MSGRIKMPTEAGLRMWRELRAAGHSPLVCDGLVYHEMNQYLYWRWEPSQRSALSPETQAAIARAVAEAVAP